ncbi:MAG: hypothetical protein ACRDFS_07040, partial [Chloroflexota bacterium]
MNAAAYSIIQGKQIPFTATRLRNDQVELDPRNPRVQYLVGQLGGGITQAQLDAMIWDKDQVKALAQSIFQNGGVREPIIVQPVKGHSDCYVVREGNCRKVCNSHLGEQYPGDERFAFIPAHIYEHQLTEEDLAILLADLHVAKKISWDAYEQAKYIHDLYVVYGKPYDWLSSHLRLSKSKISENLAAYKATTDYLQAHPSPANIKKFSFFQELMKKRDLRERYDESMEFRQNFYGWLEKERITDNKQVRTLPDILVNPEATKALGSHGYDAAAKILISNDPALG